MRKGVRWVVRWQGTEISKIGQNPVALLNPNWGIDKILRSLELTYVMREGTLGDQLSWSCNRASRIRFPANIEKDFISVGHNPWLQAKRENIDVPSENTVPV